MSDKRVAVAMSGGVDSSAAAAILKENGYDVIGLTLKRWTAAECVHATHDIRDARQVADILKIPHQTVELDDAFKENVVDYFINTYRAGKTPNPCAVCNPAIKFGKLMKKARALGADYLATGHYAEIIYDNRIGRYILKRGKDRNKDQSYFLARLSQEALSRTLFPAGAFTKDQIRSIADRFKLPVASKNESQEVCFIPDEDVPRFIRRHSTTPVISGNITDTEGRILGEHNGITDFTIGQRKGLGIAVGKPLYVVKIIAETNTVVVGDDDALYHTECIASDPHWIAIDPPDKPLRIKAKIRYRHQQAPATILLLKKNRLQIAFDSPQRAITPGQLAVFYNGDDVAGSAWIDHVI